MQIYSKLLKNLEVRDGVIYPRSHVQNMLREVTLDYDLSNEIEDLFRLHDNAHAMERAVDLMLTQNDPMIRLNAGFKSSIEYIKDVNFSRVHEFIDDLEVKKLRNGGLLSRLPLLGVLYSYDIHCFSARLAIYLEDVVENQKEIKHVHAKLKSFITHSQGELVRLRTGLQDILSAASGFESVLFNTLSGTNVTTWVYKSTTQNCIQTYNELIDCATDIKKFISLMDDAMQVVDTAISVIEGGTKEVYLDGIYSVARAFSTLESKDVTLIHDYGAESFIESKGDGGTVHIYTAGLEGKFKAIRECAEIADSHIESALSSAVEAMREMSSIKLSKVEL